MSRRRLGLVIGLVFTVATTVAGPIVWIHGKLDDKISSTEFDRFMNLQMNNQQEILNRLRSIEEAIREIGR